jgi:glycosyltransferase involved in cell wall biosynthesis
MNLSVALCTFNGAAYLPALLASLAAQTRRPAELVVCDDRSNDGTVALLREFAAAAPFPVRLRTNPEPLGSTRNFDLCLNLCSGDALFLCDQDDIWHPDKLERMAAAFAEGAGVGMVAADSELVGPAGERLGRRQWANLGFRPPSDNRLTICHLLPFNVVTGAAAAFRADFLDLIRPIPPIWVHDAWVALLAVAVSEVRLVREPVIDYRQHAGQQIGATQLTLREQIRRARKMDAAYFAKTAACFEAAADRLAQFRERVKDPEVIDLIRAKAAFARAQQRMRQGSRLGRLVPALRLLAAGEYGRFSRGWKGFAADLLL